MVRIAILIMLMAISKNRLLIRRELIQCSKTKLRRQIFVFSLGLREPAVVFSFTLPFEPNIEEIFRICLIIFIIFENLVSQNILKLLTRQKLLGGIRVEELVKERLGSQVEDILVGNDYHSLGEWNDLAL